MATRRRLLATICVICRNTGWVPYRRMNGHGATCPDCGRSCEDRCFLDLDSPSYPPERDEYRQCGCSSCRRQLQGRGGAQFKC